MRISALLIAGPTASGKSGLALSLAESMDAAIVNADSMQVYRDLRILTARPGPEEERRVPHRLYGHVDAATPYSVAAWLADAEAVLANLREEGRPAIIVGGTGLYFKALTEGLSRIPEVDADVRAHWRGQADLRGSVALHEELARRDPATAARLEPGDTQRIVRALEVVDATGRPLSEWQAERTRPILEPDRALRLVLAPDRQWLHARINERFEAMVEEGALEEAAALAARDLDPALPAMKAIGLRELAAAHAGELGPSEAIERAKTETRRYAKRQETFFRGQLGDWLRRDPASVDPAEIAGHFTGT